MSTVKIIKKCKENNYTAQLEVYNSYKNMMLNSVIQIVKNKSQAEDIVQDSFIKGFQKIKNLDNNANLGAWLKRIAINNSLDYLRNKKKFNFIDDSSILELCLEEKEEEVDESISIDFIKKCIHQLKEKYRIILVLYLIEDYNHREIGEMLSLNESTVRNQYKRGKDLLLKMIQQ
ncbi:RNA polymerase sigma factor [Polaribacter sp. KT 15]|uniref:RNA polymerase sigma factor n=1 Tax=Polaribacter sp. KT 15 TaxID=1896175 RepID=UPI0009094F45|nr:sigma-70 family RNA polymerase sigma factor [Polaribacter sp. KT 15]SHM72497.1 RNA polymerase sigma-70 factor, ECF subfamily [Polaribacter sp. KT 15]